MAVLNSCANKNKSIPEKESMLHESFLKYYFNDFGDIKHKKYVYFNSNKNWHFNTQETDSSIDSKNNKTKVDVLNYTYLKENANKPPNVLAIPFDSIFINEADFNYVRKQNKEVFEFKERYINSENAQIIKDVDSFYSIPKNKNETILYLSNPLLTKDGDYCLIANKPFNNVEGTLRIFKRLPKNAGCEPVGVYTLWGIIHD